MSCLDETTLGLLARGQLTDPALALAHVADCAKCTAALKQARGRTAPTRDLLAAPEAPTRGLHGASGLEISGPAPVAERIGPYVLLERLGEGGMGAVYTAYHPELDRKVALKLLRPEQESGEHSATAQARLLREAQAMAKLDHPNVVAVHDVGSYQNKVYLVMDRVEGWTLKEWLDQKKRPWREILTAFAHAGRGLAAAHGAGLVHRDFKPSNVLVGKDGRVRVTDFGLARAASNSTEATPSATTAEETTLADLAALATPLTRADSVIGTPAYMAPEQFLGRPGDARTDQFSFCVALYEALYGERPFAKKFDPLVPPAIREAPKDSRIPRFVRAALLRGLATSPEQRFATMDGLLEALGRDPSRRRNVAFAVGGVALLVICAAVTGALSSRRTVVAGCEDTQHALAGTWDDARRQALLASFAQTGVKSAGLDGDNTVRALDEYAGQWEREHAAACQGASAAKASEMTFSRLTCLARQQDQLKALVEVLTHADAVVVSSGLNAAGNLLPPARCADPRLLASTPRPAADPKVRAEAAAIRLRLAAAWAVFKAGKPKLAAERLRPLVGQASALAYRPVEAEVLNALGQAETDMGHARDGEASLRKAENAAEAGADDVLAAESAGLLAFLLAQDTGRPAEAHQWLDRARALLERAGADPLTESRIENAASVVAATEGKDEERLGHSQRAYELRKQVLGPRHPLTLRYQANLAVAYSDLCRFQEASQTEEEAIAELEKVVGPYHSSLITPLSNHGTSLLYLGRVDEGARAVDRAVAIVQRSADAETWIAASALQSRLQILLDTGRFSDALDVATAVSVAARKGGGEDSTLFADSLTGRGVALEALGKHAQALPVLQSAVALFEKADNPEAVSLVDPLRAAASASLGLRNTVQARALIDRAAAVLAKHCGYPGQAASVRFIQAQTLVAEHGDAARALALALQAREELAGTAWRKWQLDEVDAWLKARRAR